MTRSHIVALLGGLGIGIGIGVVAIFLILNRVESITPPPVVATMPAPLPAPQAATGATSKPMVHAKMRRFTGAAAPGGSRATADSRGSNPPAGNRAAPPIGSGGTIFSGADANDPRVQHFTD